MNQALTQTDQVVEMPLPINDVRLVYPITDPNTGITKDTMIKQLVGKAPDMQSDNMTLDRWEYGQKWDRLAPGLNVVIPWPEVKAPKFETHDRDTPRDQVEDRTFYYNLISAPMPPPVLDELRNKFSRFRTRHEGWYVAKMEHKEMLKKRRSETVKSMMMPMDELYEENQKTKATKPEPQLSADMLEKLGQIIAKTKSTTLQDSGMAEVKEKAFTREKVEAPAPQ